MISTIVRCIASFMVCLAASGDETCRHDETCMLQSNLLVQSRVLNTAHSTSRTKLVDIQWRRRSLSRGIKGTKRKPNNFNNVDVLVGTGGHVHTYPGATTPWGMVIATPWAHSSELSTWDTQSGFNSDVEKLSFFGMAHSALSGAGSGELGELRLLPLDNISEEKSTLFTRDCSGSPGYFRGRVGSANKSTILVQSSVTKRAAIHSISFDKPSSKQGILLSLMPADNNFWGYSLMDYKLKATSDSEIEGCSLSRVTGIGNAESLLCFVISSDVPFDSKFRKNTSLQHTRLTLKLAVPSKQVTLRVGISRTDIPHARFNLEQELGTRQFDDVVASARQLWEEALGVAAVEIEPPSRAKIFYTGLYHSMLAPHLLSEADGSYRLQRKHLDKPSVAWMQGESVILKEVDIKMPIQHMQPGHNMYTTFSLWDTYRAEHPLLNLIHPTQSSDFGLSLMHLADAWGFLPSFQLIQSPADMMEGDGGNIILATMALEGIVDGREAFRILNKTRRVPFDERGTLINGGFVSQEIEHSVSRSLEQAKADQCASLVARSFGFTAEARNFKKQAGLVFKQHWDPKRKIFAPVNPSNLFQTVESVTDQTSAYQEGTALQYSFGAEFDIKRMIRKHGGRQQFIRSLDYFFNSAPEAKGQADLTGNHHGLTLGDEPSMHTPYLYGYAGQLNKTSDLVDDLVKHMFKHSTDGLPGNDDLGAMSSWIVFSMLGFYPVFPCSGHFALGRPFISSARLSVLGGQLEIKVHNQGDNHRHIQRATWNGRELNLLQPTLEFSEISKGGKLEMWMVA